MKAAEWLYHWSLSGRHLNPIVEFVRKQDEVFHLVSLFSTFFGQTGHLSLPSKRLCVFSDMMPLFSHLSSDMFRFRYKDLVEQRSRSW